MLDRDRPLWPTPWRQEGKFEPYRREGRGESGAGTFTPNSRLRTRGTAATDRRAVRQRIAN